jgi:catechol 2,3-dioxygenase-like lactoylglutathione lyase family enzyme
MIRLTIALAVLLVPGIANVRADGQTPPLNGIAHVALRVRSLDASRDFYQKLGFEQAFTLAKDGSVTQAFIKINNLQFIELYPVTPKDPVPGFLHPCFEGIDLAAIHEDFSGRGLTPTPLDKDAAGNLHIFLAGPAQPSGPQIIEYTQYLPDSLHSADEGQHLGPDRVSEKLIAVSLVMSDPNAARDFYINQLNFKPIAGDQMDLHMPGNSGQEIEIVPASIGSQARLTLETQNIGKAVRRLHKEGVAAVKNGSTLTITDPDGNIILLESR